MITIFTPLYNREHSIRDTYVSLLEQTSDAKFEWLVINDGSSDKSDDIMRDIIGSHKGCFEIEYISRPNKGLNRTLNEAIATAKGELFCRLDSDDKARPNLIEGISEFYPEIKERNDVCALVFLSDHGDTTNGYHPFKDKTICDFLQYRDRYKAKGDRVEVMKTAIYRKFPYPEFENEKFCPEGIVWNRLSGHYTALYLPCSVMEKSFVSDSITSSIYKVLSNNITGTLTYYSEIANNRQASMGYRLLNSIKYFRYRLCKPKAGSFDISFPFNVLGVIGGGMVMLYDKFKQTV